MTEDNTNKCVWVEVFDLDASFFYSAFIFIANVLTTMFSCWVCAVIYKTNLRLDLSYYNLFKFTVIGTFRQAIGMFLKFKFIDSSPIVRCKTFAFLESFWAVAEIEALTMACIERYVLAKYKINGWARNAYHNMLYNLLIFIFASVYSFAPLVGIGQYGYDFTCLSCTYDMVLPSFWLSRYLTVLVFFLKSVKPACFMIMMLIWARTMENKLPKTVENQLQKRFTNIMVVVTVVNILCWAPVGLIRGSVVLNQLLYGDLVIPPASAVLCSFILHCVSPAISAISLFAVDSQIRSRMLCVADKVVHESGENDQNRPKKQ